MCPEDLIQTIFINYLLNKTGTYFILRFPDRPLDFRPPCLDSSLRAQNVDWTAKSVAMTVSDRRASLWRRFLFGVHWIGAWVGPRAGVELWEKTENFFPFPESALGSAFAHLLFNVEMDNSINNQLDTTVTIY